MQTDLELDRRCIHLGYIISRIEILGAVQQLFFDECVEANFLSPLGLFWKSSPVIQHEH